jgi:hypothetical protein
VPTQYLLDAFAHRSASDVRWCNIVDGYMGDGAAMLNAGPAVKAAQPMKRTGRETPAEISWCFHQ